jgi:hypothetical protein
MSSVVSGTRRRHIGLLGAAVVVELLLVAVYFASTAATVVRPAYVLVPFVWINVGVWAALRTDPPVAPRRQQVGAIAVAVTYFLVLGWLAGLFGVVTDAPSFVTGLRVGMGSPGWERLVYIEPPVFVSLVPYRFIGYLALSYLVYVSVLETASHVLSGALGLVSCISCSFPVVASLLAGVVGGASGFGAVYANAVALSTAVYVLAVGLLYWRVDVVALRKLTARLR